MDKKSRLSILKNFKKFELLELIEHHFSVEELQKFCYCKNRNQILKVIKNTFSLEELQEIFMQHFGCEINDYCLEKFELKDFDAKILEKQNENNNLAVFDAENLQNQIEEINFENKNVANLDGNNDKLDFEERDKCFAFSSLCERVKPLGGFISLENEINANINGNNDKLDFENEINANINGNNDLENDKKHILLPKEELEEVTIRYNEFYEKYNAKPFFSSLQYLNKISGNNKSFKNKGKRHYSITL